MTPRKRKSAIYRKPKNKRAAPDQGKATLKNSQPKNLTIDDAVLKSRSTATEVQRAKLLAMLDQKPCTTIEARDSGIMMPAARCFELKHAGHNIITELVAQYDGNGFLHRRCARYHLVKPVSAESK
jgi:hypothetical protein